MASAVMSCRGMRVSMEHCGEREGVLQGLEGRSPVRGPALWDAAVDGGQQTGTEVWNLRAGLCASVYVTFFFLEKKSCFFSYLFILHV